MIAKVRWRERDFWLDATASGQGGRFDTTVQANFGLALVLDSSEAGLEKIPPRQASEPLNHVVETFDIREGTRETATLKVRSVYRDEEADALRVRMRTQTATELGKEYLEYYRKWYPAIRVVKPLEVNDIRDANSIATTETYQIDAPFEKDAEGKRKFYLNAYLVSDRTGVPKQTDRTTPLARRHPMSVRHEIVAYLPGHWNIEPAEVKLSTRLSNTLDYRVQGRDAVARLSAAKYAGSCAGGSLKKFLVNLDKAHDDAFFTLTDGEDAAASAAPPATGSSIRMIFALIAGLGVGAAIALWIARLRWRLPDAEPGAPQGLGGWMILPVIGLLVSPVMIAINTRTWFHEIGTSALFAALAEKVQWMALLELGLLGVTTAVSLMALWLLFARKRTFPIGFIALQLLSAAILVTDATMLILLGETLASSGYTARDLVLRPLIMALWIMYVLVSQRVRATFVNPWRFESRVPEPAASAEPAASLLAEERFQRRACGVGFAGRRDIGAHLRLEVIAEVGGGLVAHFFGRGLAAVLGDARVVLHAQAAHVQLGVAGFALVEPPQRQR